MLPAPCSLLHRTLPDKSQAHWVRCRTLLDLDFVGEAGDRGRQNEEQLSPRIEFALFGVGCKPLQ